MIFPTLRDHLLHRKWLPLDQIRDLLTQPTHHYHLLPELRPDLLKDSQRLNKTEEQLHQSML
jgi:hypothetical protein